MHEYLDASHYNDPVLYDALRNGRRAVLAWTVDQFLSDLRVGATVIDFGAAFGDLGLVLRARDCSVIDVERNRRAREIALGRDPTHRVVGSLHDVALVTDIADAVVAIDSLYYVESPRTALADMARLLRPGGRLVMRNTSGELRWLARKWFGPDILGDACWGFTVAGMAAAVRAAGLELTGVTYFERARGAGVRGLYYLVSGVVTTLFAGRLVVSPGWVMTAIKPAR